MNLDFSPYATGGAAARADSFTRLDPNFATGVYGLTQAAHAAGIPLQITSAYRSPELQAQLYASALERYGSPQAARRWVAPPGRSQHNYGTAVDFALNGSLLRDADSPAAQFIRNNAEQYGLSVPMDWEPWQVEPVGSRDGSRPQATVNTRNAPTNTQTTGVQMDGTQQSSGELSRNQRMMLGFAALRDAGAALQGQNSNFFANTMGGFQQQAQAADDRAFRQMQFDRGVTEFDIAQAGSQAERGLRREQEGRLIDERNQQTQMAALQSIADIERQIASDRQIAAAQGVEYTPNPMLQALMDTYTRQLMSAGGSIGASPTQGTGETLEVPEMPEVQVDAQPDSGMDVNTAASIIDTPGSSADDIRAARTYLENLPQGVVSGVGETRINSLLSRSGGAIEAAETAVVAAGNAAQMADDFKFYGTRVADFLVEGYEDGEPVYNPALMTRPGRVSQAFRQTPEYQAFNSALGFIANNLTFEKMASMKAAGITFGSLSNEELQQVARTASTLDVNDPIGTYTALRRVEDRYGIDLGLGGAAPQGTTDTSGRSDEELLEFYLGGGQ